MPTLVTPQPRPEARRPAAQAEPDGAGPLSSGPLSEGPLSEGPLSEGPLSEGPLSEGPLGTWLIGVGPPGGEALIAEARARRRRRWLAGLVSVSVAAAGLATWFGRASGGPVPALPTAPNAQLTAATSCANAMSYGPLPVWARSGFHPPGQPMHYVLGAHGDIVAVLWGHLYSPPRTDINNKVLWVSRLALATYSSLEITARRLVGGTEVGPVVRRTVAGGPGPSGINMPQAGCWQFNLRWSGHADSVDLAYTAPQR